MRICPVCDDKVRDSAITCPSCGEPLFRQPRPLPPSSGASTGLILVLVIGGVLLLGAAAAVGMGAWLLLRPAPVASGPPPAPVAVTPSPTAEEGPPANTPPAIPRGRRGSCCPTFRSATTPSRPSSPWTTGSCAGSVVWVIEDGTSIALEADVSLQRQGTLRCKATGRRTALLGRHTCYLAKRQFGARLRPGSDETRISGPLKLGAAGSTTEVPEEPKGGDTGIGGQPPVVVPRPGPPWVVLARGIQGAKGAAWGSCQREAPRGKPGASKAPSGVAANVKLPGASPGHPGKKVAPGCSCQHQAPRGKPGKPGASREESGAWV